MSSCGSLRVKRTKLSYSGEPAMSKPDRNTGYEFDLVDREKAERDENGLMKNFMARMGNYDTRHEAVGMKALLERHFPEMDYEVRAWESLWRERDEPVICGYCGHEEWYMPLVRWTFAADCDDSPFCSTECWARWMWENDPDHLRGVRG